MTLTPNERYAIVQYRIEKAKTTMIEAKAVASQNFWNLAANRLYYACYYAASAILIAKGLEANTHAGVSRMLSLHFVKTGIITNEESKLMKHLFMMRQSGDYDDMFDWTAEDVLPVIEPTETLLAKLTAIALQ